MHQAGIYPQEKTPVLQSTPEPKYSSCATLVPFIGFVGYGISAVALGSVGYLVHGIEMRQNELLKERKEILTANRARRLAAEEA